MTDKDPFIEVAAGNPIFKEGDAGTEMYIIESGTVDILRSERGSEPIATLEAGDFFGEMAILEDQPRFATAVARGDCRLLRIDRSAFSEVLTHNVEIGIRIMRKLTARLRRAEQRAVEAHAALDEFKRRLAAKAEAKPAAPRAEAKPEAPPAAKPAVAVVEAPQIEAPQIEAPVIEAPRVEAPAAAAAPAPPPAPAPAAHGALIHRPTNQTFVLAGRPEFLVGRPDPVTGINPEVNLGPLDETRSLSRRHAKIAVNDGIYVLREDVGTTNGTFVNGERITTGAPVMLKPGDKIRFGSVEVEFTV